jgi:3'-5' exoribonuclease
LEFGSPKVPIFPEALLLHHLDNMDSKMECMRHLAETDRQVEGCFTSYNSSLDRVVLKKDRYLNGKPSSPPAVAADASTPAPHPAAEPAPQAAPAPPPQPAPAQPVQEAVFAPAPKINSVFADKLLQALRPAEPKPEA